MPATVSRRPGAAPSRAVTASSAWSETVRPKRTAHAPGIGSSLWMVPVAVPSPMRPIDGLETVSVIVSAPSSWASSSTLTDSVVLDLPGMMKDRQHFAP